MCTGKAGGLIGRNFLVVSIRKLRMETR